MNAGRIILIACFYLSALSLQAQAPVFSQYYSSGLYLNPALCGLEKDIYLGMNYRSQWTNVDMPFNTFQFSFIHPLSKPGVRVKHLGGLGASFLNDEAGPNKEFIMQSVSLAGAYNFHLTKYGNNILSTALQLGVTQQRVNYSALEWSSQYNPVSGHDNTRPGETGLNNQIISPQVTLGAMWYYTTRGRMSVRNISIYNGVSVSNIIRPEGFIESTKGASSTLYKLHGGVVSMRKLKYEFSPNYLIQYQNTNFQVNIGAYMSYFMIPPRLQNSKTKKVTVGAWYRLNDAFIFSTGFSNTNWNFGFSYDTNVSSMGRNLGYANAYEVSLAYKIIVNKGAKRFSSPLI